MLKNTALIRKACRHGWSAGGVTLYLVTSPSQLDFDPEIGIASFDLKNWPDVMSYITKNNPHFLILHGDADTQMALIQSESLYPALDMAGIHVDFHLLYNAEHADALFVQGKIKQIIFEFPE